MTHRGVHVRGGTSFFSINEIVQNRLPLNHSEAGWSFMPVFYFPPVGRQVNNSLRTLNGWKRGNPLNRDISYSASLQLGCSSDIFMGPLLVALSTYDPPSFPFHREFPFAWRPKDRTSLDQDSPQSFLYTLCAAVNCRASFFSSNLAIVLTNGRIIRIPHATEN